MFEQNIDTQSDPAPLQSSKTLLSPSKQKNKVDDSSVKNTINFDQPEVQQTIVSPKNTTNDTVNLNGQVVRIKSMFTKTANNDNASAKRDEDIENGAILNLEHSFGFSNTPIYKNTHFISDDSIVYPSGRHLATLDLVSRKMDFIKREDKYASSITTLQVGLSRKKELVIAIGEKTLHGTPRVSLYIPNRIRWFILDHDQEVLPQITEESKIEQIYIPNHKKYCITASRTHDKGNLVVAYFRYEKEKLSRVSEVKNIVKKICINPRNHYQFLACGKNYLKMYDAAEKVFREMKDQIIPIKYERENDFIDAVYIQESIFITVSSQNNLFIIEDNQIKYYISISFSIKNSLRNMNSTSTGAKQQAVSSGSQLAGEQQEDDGSKANISCIAAHKKGFVVGSKNGGFIGIYEIERDFSINHVDTFKVDPNCSEITSLAVSQDRSQLLINSKIQEEQSPMLASQIQSQMQYASGTDYEDVEIKERLEMYQLNLQQLSVLKNVFTLPIKQVFPKGNPVGTITNISVGVSKDIIVTVGIDRYIRVFEYAGSQHSIDRAPIASGGGQAPVSIASLYIGNFSQISSQKSKDPVYCVAVHPMGLQIAAGFKEKLKIYYLLEDEVRSAIDYPTKMCLAAKYSNGGQYLAGANGNHIYIIDPYTFEIKYALTGHPSFVKILNWNESDSMLLSVCNLGSAYGWNTNFEIYNKDKMSSNKKKTGSGSNNDDNSGGSNKIEFIMKSIKIHSVGYDEEYDLLFVSSSDNKLTLYSTENGKGIKNYMQIFTGADTELTSLLLAKQQQVLFAGTNKGCIRVYLWPIIKKKSNLNLLQQQAESQANQHSSSYNQNQSETQIEYMEYFVHLDKVVNLELSADKQSLISSSEDGSIYVLSIKEICNKIDMNINVSLLAPNSSIQYQEILQKKKKSQMLNKCKVHLNMNQLSLVFRQAIESKNANIQELKYKVENLKSYFQEELQNIANEKTAEINKINEKNAKELEEEKSRYKGMQEEHENERNYLLKTIENNLEAHKKELKEINDDYQLKLKNAYKQHDKLVEAYEESKMTYKKELEAILDKNKEALEQIEKEYRIKYEELQKNHIRLINDMKRDGEKFDVALEQCEQEYEKELLKRRDDFQAQMTKIQKQYDDLRESHEKVQRDKDTLQKKLDDCQEIQFKLGQEQEQFHKKILDSNTRLVKMQEQLGEREEVIKHKEKNVKDLRNINTHLENFRFVLDHKIRSLKDEKLPMESQIKNLEKHIKQMYQELLEECEKKKELMNNLKSSDDKLGVLKQQLKKKQDEVIFTKRKLELLQYDLGNLIRNEQLNDWPEKVAKLYEKHFNEKTANKTSNDVKSPGKQDEVVLNNGGAGGSAQQDEEFSIKEELLRQNNWMNNKLKSIMDKNTKLEKEKKDLYLKIQKENTELIKECNMLRTSNQKISKKVLVLEKKLKDISGISLSNANLVENQLEGFLKKAAPLSTKHKETPFMQLKKGNTSNKRNQMLVDYYHQYAMPQSPNMDSMEGEGTEQQQYNLDGLLGDMEHNQNQIQSQNYEIQQLQEKVNQFLRQPADESSGAKNQTLPPISGGLNRSESQPVFVENQMSSLKKDEQNRFLSNVASQRTLQKPFGGVQSTTISNASIMMNNSQQQQIQANSTIQAQRKDSKHKQL